MVTDPDLPEAHALRGWFDAIGKDVVFKSRSSQVIGSTVFNRSELKPLADIKALGTSPDKTDFFTTRATVIYIKPDCVYYAACPKCSKKVGEREGAWVCDKCSVRHQAPAYRWDAFLFICQGSSG